MCCITYRFEFSTRDSVGDVVAALMVVLRVYSRAGDLLLAHNMLFALVLVHRADLFTLTKMGGWALTLQGIYLFSGLAILLLRRGRLAIKPD
jgi:putative oxidoreductase